VIGFGCVPGVRFVAVADDPDQSGNPGQPTIVRVTVVGMANLAVKVIDLQAAREWYRAAGATVSDPVEWENGRRCDVKLGWLNLTLFTAAIYEDACALPAEGFLHPALFVDDLDAELVKHDVLWGPRIVSGSFGTRRIAFVEAPGGIRLEFMEQLEEPA
jgi:catechol 2,3-dioxygenase-like lactoylglutathione lyase family enzyme